MSQLTTGGCLCDLVRYQVGAATENLTSAYAPGVASVGASMFMSPIMDWNSSEIRTFRSSVRR
jgi:hypothetical protein